MATTKRCYYEVLSVTREADDTTIKTAYRKIAWENHPDRNHDDHEAEARFKEASEAYEVLRDPQKRQLYDRYGHKGLESRGAAPHFDDVNSIFDMFGSLFGDLFGGRQGRGSGGPRPGRDLQLNLRIGLLDAYRGGRKTVTIPREENCKTCSGSGMKPGTNPPRCRRCEGRGVILQGQSFFRMQTECPACSGRGVEITDPCPGCKGAGQTTREESIELTIPPGVDDGVTMRVNGQGEAGAPGAVAGDLYVVFQVEPHELFARHDLDLHCKVPITFSQAALGGNLEVPTLEGEMRLIDLPRGSQAGDEVRLRGLGMPALRGQKRGDIVVHLRLLTPRQLTKRQEDLLRELGQLDESHVPPERKSFLDRIKEFFGGK